MSTALSEGTTRKASFSTDRYPNTVTSVIAIPASVISAGLLGLIPTAVAAVDCTEPPKISVFTANQQNISTAMMAEITLAPTLPKANFRVIDVERRVFVPTWEASRQMGAAIRLLQSMT